MALYEMATDRILPIRQTSFAKAGLKEREDLQRLLKTQIDVVCEDVLVIAEGFRDWEDSRRELDLLAVDRDGQLVVIELKRTEDAGHAELQAVRYAAMVSAMTFEKAVDTYADHLRHTGEGGEASAKLLEFLGWDEPDEDNFGQDVRIVLVAADFSRELTTSVMWLNERDLDIRCVRIRPYMDGGRVLVDVQQVIPLPEAQDYVIRIREKAVKERQDRIDQGGRKALRKRFWDSLLQLSADKTDLFKNVSPSPDSWIATGSGISGLHYVYWLRQHTSSVRFIIEGDKATNKLRFDWLYERREQVEKVFGGPLRWDRCDDLKQSRLYVELPGGYRDPEENWPQTHAAMVDAMCRIVEAISPFIQQLRQIEADSAKAV